MENIDEINNSGSINIKDFYEKQQGNISQLVSNFSGNLPDSCKKSIEMWNMESLKNVIKSYELFITTGTKDFITCAKELGIENIGEDLNFCANQAIMQQFCKYKELYLDRIDNEKIDFLNFKAIKIIEPQQELSKKNLIKEIRNGVRHSKNVCLPEGLYIDNPKGKNHKISFKAIIKRDFLKSIGKMYYKMQKYYMNDVDCRDINNEGGFDENKNNIKITKFSLKDKKSEISFMEFLKDQDALETEYIKAKKGESRIFELRNRSLTKGESKILSDFFGAGAFGGKEGELKLEIGMMQTDLSYKILMRLMPFLKSKKCSFKDLYNDKFNRHYNSEFLNFIGDSSIYKNLIKKYSINKVNIAPSALKNCLDELIYKVLLENKGFVSNEGVKIKDMVYDIVKNRIRNGIYEWNDFTDEQKKLYGDMMVKDAMLLFNNEYYSVYGKYLQSEIGLYGVLNQLKALYISNYYVNDPSFIPIGNVVNIPEREHIRNAFGHGNYLALPGTDWILLWDPSQKDGGKDWEHLYNLNRLYERCSKKSYKRFT